MTDLEKEIQEIEAAKPVETEVVPEPAVIPENIDHIPADDTVSLYFRQMASEPLLTAEQEVSLAKRIQRGLEAQRALEENQSLTFEQVHTLEEICMDGQ